MFINTDSNCGLKWSTRRSLNDSSLRNFALLVIGVRATKMLLTKKLQREKLVSRKGACLSVVAHKYIDLCSRLVMLQVG